jgi:hypothetical protein
VTPSIIVAFISASAAVIVPAISYSLTKWKDREADWRKYKFEHYREFVLSLSGVVEGDASPEGHKRFAKATNTLHLIASAAVIGALHEYRDEIRVSNLHRSQDRHDALLTKLLVSIRIDLGLPHRTGDPEFQARLWCSGQEDSIRLRDALGPPPD